MRKSWPKTTFCTTVNGVFVTVEQYAKLENADDPDVGYAYSPFGVCSAGPDAGKVIARGRQKAIFTKVAPITQVPPSVLPLTGMMESLGGRITVRHGEARGDGDANDAYVTGITAAGEYDDVTFRCVDATGRETEDIAEASAVKATVARGHLTTTRQFPLRGKRKSNITAWVDKARMILKKAEAAQQRHDATMKRIGVSVTADDDDDWD